MRPKVLAALMLVLAQFAPAQQLPDQDRSLLPVAVEFATFRASGGLTTLEVYLEVPSASKIFKENGRNYLKELATAVLLKHRGQIVEFADASLRDATSRALRSEETITGRVAFTVRPGEYDLQVVVEDRGSVAFDQTFAVNVPTYSYNSLDISDIVLARQVSWSGRVATTSRLGLKVTPAVPVVFGQNKAWIWYMLEIYGLSPQDTITLSSSVMGDSAAVVAPKAWRVAAPANTFTQRGALLLGNTSPGNYRFMVEIAAAGDTARQMAEFTIVPGDTAATDSDATDTLTAQGGALESALGHLSKRDLKNMADDFKRTWRSFDARRFSSQDSDEQQSRITALADRLEGVSAGELVDRWQLVRLLDAGRARRKGLSARAQLVLKNGPPQVVRIAPATFVQSESQLWVYGDDGPIYFLVDIDGRGTFEEVDGEKVPLLLLQSIAAFDSYIDSATAGRDTPPDSVTTSQPVDSTDAAIDSDIEPGIEPGIDDGIDSAVGAGDATPDSLVVQQPADSISIDSTDVLMPVDSTLVPSDSTALVNRD